MRPHRNFGRNVDKPEVARFALPRFALTGVDNVQMEECVIVTRMVVHIDGGELLVGGHERGGDVMCQEVCLSVHV